MKKIILILAVLLVLPFVSADCCVIEDDCEEGSCSYWDFEGWSNGQLFCTNYGQFECITTTWYNESCVEIPEGKLPESCRDGWTIPEFSTVTAGIALLGAGAGFILLRKKR